MPSLLLHPIIGSVRLGFESGGVSGGFGGAGSGKMAAGDDSVQDFAPKGKKSSSKDDQRSVPFVTYSGLRSVTRKALFGRTTRLRNRRADCGIRIDLYRDNAG